MLKNTAEGYGLVAKSFHWLVALAVVGLLIVGFVMGGLEMPLKLTTYFWHKSVGIFVLALVIARFCWRIYNHPPTSLSTHKKWEKILAHSIHYALYITLLLMPLSGWFMSSAKGYTVNVAGLFSLPDFVRPDKALADLLADMHYYLAFTIIGLLTLHIMGALKHHFIDRDHTLRRMTWLLVAALLLMPLPSLAASKWLVDDGASTLNFRALQGGTLFEGAIGKYTTDITFSPDDLANSKALIEMDMSSAKTGKGDLDSYIGAPEWFGVSIFPTATFTSQRFDTMGNGKYMAIGTLKIRDIALPVSIPFSFIEADGKAIVEGSARLNRIKFGLGTTPDLKDEKTVSHMVNVTFRLEAKKQ